MAENTKIQWCEYDLFSDGLLSDARRQEVIRVETRRKREFARFDANPNTTFVLITSHPENIRRMWDYSRKLKNGRVSQNEGDNIDVFRPNVWLGCSVSDQATADEALDELEKCRDLCPVLWCSYEPALGPVDFSRWLSWLRWIVCGGESGPHARPFDLAWARSTIEQCRAAGVACFVKQLGSRPIARYGELLPSGNREEFIWLTKDKKGGDIEEFPPDLRVREFPLAERP